MGAVGTLGQSLFLAPTGETGAVVTGVTLKFLSTWKYFQTQEIRKIKKKKKKHFGKDLTSFSQILKPSLVVRNSRFGTMDD